jgi:hypothetical protein
MSIRKYPIAYLALFVALGGTAYAATALPPGSVGTRQLKNGAVTNAKVRPHSLHRNAFARGVLERPVHTTVQSLAAAPSAEPSAGGPITINVPCPGGQRAVGGGWDLSQAGASANVSVSKPYADDDGWTVTFTPDREPFGLASVYAVCAS